VGHVKYALVITLIASPISAAPNDICVVSADHNQISIQRMSDEPSRSICKLDCSLNKTDATHTTVTCKLGIESSTKPACASVNFDDLLSEAAVKKQFNCDNGQP
jgi:hypothetical protein